MLLVRSIKKINPYLLLGTVLTWPIVVFICLETLLPAAKQISLFTNGLIQPTLLFSVLLLLVVILAEIHLLGKIPARDIGLSKYNILPGVIITLSVWILLQVILIFLILIGNEPLSTSLNIKSGTGIIGPMMAQLFGNAFVEELMFRGFLIPQLYLNFGGRDDNVRGFPLIFAILVSQLIFTLVHIPNLHRLGSPDIGALGSLLVIFILGIFFALVYIRTANIFVVIGLHALINTPTALIVPIIQPQVVVILLALLVLILWPVISKTFQTYGIEE